MGNTIQASTDPVCGEPIEFHQVHATNVELSSNCRQAHRVDGQRGLCFSNRPVSVGERVFIKITATSQGRRRKGIGIRFGYTAIDPSSDNTTLIQGQVRCSELHASEHGYWVKAVNEAFTKRGCVLGFCICVNGDVAYGNADELLGILFSGVRTDIPLWVVVDLSGSASAVEFVEVGVSAKSLACGRTNDTLVGYDARRFMPLSPSVENSPSSASEEMECSVLSRRCSEQPTPFSPGLQLAQLPAHSSAQQQNVRTSNTQMSALQFSVQQSKHKSAADINLGHLPQNPTVSETCMRASPACSASEQSMVSDVVNFRHSVTTASTSTTRGKSWHPQRQSKRTTRSSSYSDELPLSSHPYSMESSSSNHGRPSYTAEQNANSVAIHTSSKACRYRATDVNKLMPFHATACGRNVSLSADCFTATRLRSDYCNAYVFTQHPLWPGHEVVIRIISTSRDYAGGLTVGLTSCDPISIKVADLPDDADLLLDRPEYWVVHKNICSHPKVNDELAFYRTLSGELKYYRNGRESGTLMHVDCTLPLWAFFDIYGSTQRIQIIGIVRRSVPGNQIAPAVINDLPLGSHHEYSHQSVVDDDIQLSSHNPLCEHLSHLSLAANIQTETSRLGSLGNQRGTTSECQSVLQQSSVFSTASVTDFLHGIPVTLPPPLIPIPENLSHESITDGTTSLCEEGKPQIASTSADDRIVKLSSTGYESVAGSQHQQVNAPTRGECAICMECEPDCALYPCGHMCMCHSCAMNVQKQRSALCPICRQPIVDILRIYRT